MLDPSGMGLNRIDECCPGPQNNEDPGVTIRRYRWGFGHQYLHVPLGGLGAINIGWNAPANNTPGAFVLEEPQRCDDSSQYFEWATKRVRHGTLQGGSAKGKCCRDATAGDILSCMDGRIALAQGMQFGIVFRNCRRMSNVVITKCCLRRGKLIHSPPGDDTPPGLGQAASMLGGIMAGGVSGSSN